MNKFKLITISALVILLLATGGAQADIVGVSLGTDAPPGVLGPYAMTPFPVDPQGSSVTSVDSPLGGTVDFFISMTHLTVGSGWATWSHGYTGDVYFTGYYSSSVTLTLPSSTGAFYLYGEPNPFAWYLITATAQDGTSVTQLVDGYYGAAGYGFYGTGGDVIVSIQVDYFGYSGFAVGEFGIGGEYLIPNSDIEKFNVCSADIACLTGVASLLPYVGTPADFASWGIGVCSTAQRFDEGDPLGGIMGVLKLVVDIVNTLSEKGCDLPTGTACEIPYTVIDGIVTAVMCAESQLWEYAEESCGGYTFCLWEGLQWIEGKIIGVFTGSPVDIRIIDSQGNVMKPNSNGYTDNDLSSPGWIFKGPNHQELALVFGANDNYIVEIVGRPEAGTGATFKLQILRQDTDGSQTLLTYSNVPIAAGGIATAIASEELEPVLKVDIDGDGTIDATFLPEPPPVNNLLRISSGLVSFDRRTGQFSVNVTITNTSSAMIGNPVWLVIESISNAGVTLANPDGTTADGKPYLDLSGLLGDGVLNPAESVNKRIYFNNPNRLKFTFTPSVRGVVLL